MKILDAKAANWTKIKKEVILEAQKEQKKVHFASTMDIYFLKSAELEPKHQEKLRTSRALRRHCERRLRCTCKFTEQES